MQRYEKIVFEGNFEFSKGTSGELICRVPKIVPNVYSWLPTVSAGEYAEVLSVYTDNAKRRAVVLPGWTVSGVQKENTIFGKDESLVIYRIPEEKVIGIDWKNQDEVETLMRTYDQLVWTPVECLTANATLDGIQFNEKFGRMNYRNVEFSESEYHEPLVGDLLLQKESIDKYGGYYSSRYRISEDKKTKKPRSVKGAIPWTDLNFLDLKRVASTMIERKNIKSHLMYGAEYDTREKWLIESSAVTIKEIAEDSIELGNYHNCKNWKTDVAKTGEHGCINNIYGFSGNVYEWTQEQYGSSCTVIRGGAYNDLASDYPADNRKATYGKYGYFNYGFRVTIWIW